MVVAAREGKVFHVWQGCCIWASGGQRWANGSRLEGTADKPKRKKLCQGFWRNVYLVNPTGPHDSVVGEVLMN